MSICVYLYLLTCMNGSHLSTIMISNTVGSMTLNKQQTQASGTKNQMIFLWRKQHHKRIGIVWSYYCTDTTIKFRAKSSCFVGAFLLPELSTQQEYTPCVWRTNTWPAVESTRLDLNERQRRVHFTDHLEGHMNSSRVQLGLFLSFFLKKKCSYGSCIHACNAYELMDGWLLDDRIG